jgi:hypothetical protein
MPVACEVSKNEPTITEQGLMLAGVVLAKMGRDSNGRPALVIDGDEEGILARLALAYDRPVGPAVLGNIRRASENWCNGETILAAIDLALGGLSPLADVEAATLRLSLGEKLLADGLAPRDLLGGCGLDPTPLDALKAGYNPAERRIPAGNGRGSGDWTTAGNSTANQPGESGGPEPTGLYTSVEGLPPDARMVIPPDGIPIPDKDSPTKQLMAPPSADFRRVYAAGRAIAALSPLEQYPRARAAIAQEGIYDFQRDVRHKKFYHAYTPAADYAVGVYMAGAGYTLDITRAFAKIYALRYSKNYNTQDQLDWIKRGWRDAKSGRWQ